MKFTTTPSNLKQTLQTVSKIAPAKPSIPILSGVLFEATELHGDKLTLSANDLDQSIKGTVEGVEIYEAGRFVAPRQFLNVLAKLPNEPVIFESDGKKIDIKYRDNKFSLNCFDAEEFPQMPEVEGVSWKMDFDPQKVAFVASKDESRPILTTIHFNLDDGDIVCTDTHRLVLAKVQAVENGGKYNIPASFVSKLPMGAELKFGNNMVSAQYGEFVYSTRLIEGTYPNYKQIIPSEFSTKVKVNVGWLVNSVERAMLIHKVVKLEFSGFVINISAESENGSMNESMTAYIEGEELRLAVNATYLKESLSCCKDEVLLGLSGTLKPMIINPGSEWQSIMVPVRMMD